MSERLDVLLVRQKLAESREKAKAYIAAGSVFVDGKRADKAASRFEENVLLELKGEAMKYVSRGGLKLEKAIRQFGICLSERVCMDVGASTGGFTDCMLQNGAAKVYAIDVGTAQLAQKLREDRRVVSMEQTNIRHVTLQDIGQPVDFVSVDVAFISLSKVLLPVYRLMAGHAEIVCLIKPQFEAGKERIGKKGVVRDRKLHEEIIAEVVSMAAKTNFELLGLDYSPVKGPEGNIEYLLYARKEEKEQDSLLVKQPALPLAVVLGLVPQVVSAAHKKLSQSAAEQRQ